MQPHEVSAGELLANLSVGYIVLAAAVLTAIRLALVPNRTPLARSVAELVESLIIAGVLVFLVIRPFFLQAFYIPSESMEPTLQGHHQGLSATGENYPDSVNDRIFVNKLIYRLRSPKHGEIIVFRAPKRADVAAGMENREQVENVLIKRVIGEPGDTIEVKSGKVWRNGQALNEPYIKEPMEVDQQPGAEYGREGEALKLKGDEVFVMGDNRNHSNDSRFWGPLKRDRVIGKASLIFWPFSRIRLIR